MTTQDPSRSTSARPEFITDDPSAPVAREGWPFVAAFAAVTALAWWGGVAWLGPIGHGAGGVGLVLTLWCVWFFRDPRRDAPTSPGAVICPADGRVVMVGPAEPPPELGLPPIPMTRICIFMNVFNVHVNRAPVAGNVSAAHYRPGKFVNAALDKASVDNERYSLAIRMADGRDVVVVQIAGLIARRIVCRTGVGATLRPGQRYGLIRFGSRVDVYLPAGSEPKVRVGEKTLAGTTVIAALNQA
jgi:phosphatidylserine decarboxylase